ncbi:MAG: hypothetical protein AAF403_03455 [Pseudomonadota bacterium]
MQVFKSFLTVCCYLLFVPSSILLAQSDNIQQNDIIQNEAIISNVKSVPDHAGGSLKPDHSGLSSNTPIQQESKQETPINVLKNIGEAVEPSDTDSAPEQIDTSLSEIDGINELADTIKSQATQQVTQPQTSDLSEELSEPSNLNDDSLIPVELENEILQELDPTFVGALRDDEKGFGVDLWQGLDVIEWQYLINHIPQTTSHFWGNDMLRRMMLTKAVLPGLVEGQSKDQVSSRQHLFQVKLKWLIEAGFLKDAERLMSSVPRQFAASMQKEIIAEFALYRQSPLAACNVLSAERTLKPIIDLICMVIENKLSAAQLKMELLRVQTDIAPNLQHLLDIAFGFKDSKTYMHSSFDFFERLLEHHLNIFKHLKIKKQDPALTLLMVAEDQSISSSKRAQAIEWLLLRDVVTPDQAIEWMMQESFKLALLNDEHDPEAQLSLQRMREFRFVVNGMEKGQLNASPLLQMVYKQNLLALYTTMLIPFLEQANLSELSNPSQDMRQKFEAAMISAFAGRGDLMIQWLDHLPVDFVVQNFKPWLVLFQATNQIEVDADHMIYKTLKTMPLSAHEAHLLGAFDTSLVNQITHTLKIEPVEFKKTFKANNLLSYQKAVYNNAQAYALGILAHMISVTDWQVFNIEQLNILIKGLQKMGHQKLALFLTRDVMIDLGLIPQALFTSEY